MSKLDKDVISRLNRTLVSLIELREHLDKDEWQIEEGYISWLQTDIQSLHIVSEKMEQTFYV